jgi:hypothetical protein
MSRRSKRKAEAEQQNSGQMQAAPPMAGYNQPSQLQVFDGKGNAAVMTFSIGKGNRINQRLAKNRSFRAHLPQTHR